uniref:Poly [ADP-ribose] polymerase 14 n=1 Tax=Magallana gigas TaxID=29159 RepID=K1PDC3_MAGGI
MGGQQTKKSNASVANATTVPLPHTPSSLNLFQARANQNARQWVKVGAVSVTVVNGSLTDEQVDVYVNGVPPNFDLSRTPSKELSDAAGPNLESECEKKFPHGVSVGAIADTGGYNLPCQRVYHVTLPDNQKDGSQNQTVTQIVKDCLARANSQGFSSIAVPDLGSTIGYPAKVLADLQFKAVEEFSNENAGPTLSQVAFVKKARKISKTGSSQTSHSKVGTIDVSLEIGNLPDQKVDVIVCSGPENLKLKNGGMAESLLQAAGPGLQTECDQKYPQGIQSGDLAITRGHNLQCQFVYHGAIPKWGTAGTPTPKQILKDFVTKCLEEANKHKMTKTLAFPTLGTGSLNYPPNQVAQVMAECIKDFDQRYPNKKLKRIIIVVYNQDKKWKTVEQAFISALNMTTATQSSPAAAVPPAVIHVSNSKGKIGKIQISFKAGELSNQQVDVIVCSGPENLKLKNGGMAESLLQAAGPGLQAECDQKYPQGIQSGDLAITGGHNLQCQYVYHGAIPKWGTAGTPTPKQILKDFVTKCLEEANKHKMTKTLAFPTLGTGSLNYPPDQVAQVMAECIKDFDQKYPQTELARITIVVYNQDRNRKTVEQAFLSAFKMSTPAATLQSPNPPTAHAYKSPVNSKPYFENLYKMKAVTPSYWTVYTSSKDLATWNSRVSSKDFKLEALKSSSQTYSAVEKLALNTWKSQFVGKGTDAVGLAQLNYTKIQITNIERLESPHLFEEYWKYREKIFLRASQKGQFKALGQIPHAKSGDVATTQIADPCLQVEIYPGINEHYLFHGTQPSLITNILTQGLDGRIANNPFFGNGVYCAESSSKSDQYADPKNQRDLHEKKMLLVRACLGEMFIRTDTANQYPYTRPPCKSCHNDRCKDPTHSAMFDSIVVDGSWNFREFILYDNKACYPEYLITYKRI